MTNRNLLIAAVAMLAVSGCATASTPEISEKAAAELAKYQLTGEKKSCLMVTQIRTIDPLDDSHFLVESAGGKKYLNVVSGRCSNASRPGYFLQYDVSGSSLCRNEIISVIDNSGGMLAGSCGLGDFEELEDAPVTDEG